MEKEIAYIKIKLDVIYAAIIGDPTDQNQPGLILRLDRLEQSNKLKNKILCLMSVGVIGTLGNIVVSLL